MVEEDTQAPLGGAAVVQGADTRASDTQKRSKRSVKHGGLRRGRGHRTCLAPDPARALPPASHRETCLAPAEGRDPLTALQVKVGVKTQRHPDPRRTPRAAHPGRRPPGRR